MESNDFEAVRALMHAVDPPPGNLDTDTVVAAGRRFDRRRRVGSAAIVGGATALVLMGTAVAVTAASRPSAPTGPAVATTKPALSPNSMLPRDLASCRIQVLPDGSAPGASLAVGDSTGRYQAGTTGLTEAGPPVLWTEGVPSLLPAPAALLAHIGNVAGVSSHGDVAVNSLDGNAWLYHDGSFTKLPKLAGYPVVGAWGISPGGDVVGEADSASGGRSVPVVWPIDRPGTVHRLATPHGGSGMAMNMGAGGTVTGSLGDGAMPFVWDPSGKGHAMAVPAGYQGGRVLDADGAWASGFVTHVGDRSVKAARWNLTTGKIDLYDQKFEAVWINRAGDFVGTDGTGYYGGFIFTDGVFHTLPTVADYTDTEPVAIAEDGHTVVGSVAFTGQSHQQPWALNVIWHC